MRIFPNEQIWRHLIRALASEQHEEWIYGHVYLDMQPLRDRFKPSFQAAA